MRVEDRLRRGLEANATAFVPEGEWRLAEVHRRRRQRTVTVLVAACAAAAVLAVGLLGGRGSQLRMLPGPAHPSPDRTEVSRDGWAGPRLPDATWFRVAAEARAAALGVPERAMAEHLGEDGRLPLALTVLDGTWAITITGDTGEVEVDDFGTAAYDEDGDLVMTSASSGCPGCRAVLRWREAGHDLVIGSADERLGPVERLVTEGTWRHRQDLVSTAASAGDCSSTRADPAREEDTMDKNTVVALSVLATLTAACSDDTDRDATASAEPPETQSTESSGDRVVESGWERETTEDQARDLGLSQRTISRYVGADGVLPLGMKLDQQTYAIYVIDDAGEPRTYDLGSYSYDDEGRLVLTTSSTGCADCATTLGWQQDGDRLMIDEVSGPGTSPLDRLVWHGAWTDPAAR
jgi:hypothetical protein